MCHIDAVRFHTSTDMKRYILHLISSLDVGGAEMMLYKLLRESRQSEFVPIVISLKTSGSVASRIEELGIPVMSLELDSGVTPFLRALKVLRHVVRTYQPALIQGWMYHGNLDASLSCRLANNKLALLWNIRQTIQSLSNEKWLTKGCIKIGAGLSSHVDHVIYLSLIHI